MHLARMVQRLGPGLRRDHLPFLLRKLLGNFPSTSLLTLVLLIGLVLTVKQGRRNRR